MTQFDLIGALRTYAQSLGWAFLPGDGFMRNYEATKKDYSVGQLILGCDPFIVTPRYTYAGKIDRIEYTGLMMLGRKFEVSTMSNLDETFIQKYDNRLLSLMGTLASNIGTFSCAQGLTVSSSRFELRINSLDENIDFIVCSVTFIQE